MSGDGAESKGGCKVYFSNQPYSTKQRMKEKKNLKLNRILTAYYKSRKRAQYVVDLGQIPLTQSFQN